MIITHSAGQYEVLFQSINLPDGLIVTDKNVFDLHRSYFENRDVVVIAPGEESKSLPVYENLCRNLAQKGVTRKSTLIAFGGGMIGDLVGFAAATYMRGLNYIQVPTTLLSQIDSSVGGKTGVDLPEGKNLVGAFYPPSQVQIDFGLLKTLPLRQFTCGLAEILKTALIQSPAMAANLSEKQLNPDDDRLPRIIEDCVKIKARVVQEDEFELTGLRAQLNFGHTVGHALEQVTNYKRYTHGEAIAVGMLAEIKIAVAIGLANKDLIKTVENLLNGHGLPTKAVELLEGDRIISAMRKDKKSSNGELSMSLVSSIGICSLVPNIDESVVREVLNESAKI